MAPKPPKHSTTDFLVVFGPRATYLVHTPGVELTSTLSVSAELQEILDGSKEINFVLYPPLLEDDADCEKEVASSLLPDPYVAYVKKKLLGESKFYIPSAGDTQDDFFSGLKEWLGHRWGSGVSGTFIFSIKVKINSYCYTYDLVDQTGHSSRRR